MPKTQLEINKLIININKNELYKQNLVHDYLKSNNIEHGRVAGIMIISKGNVWVPNLITYLLDNNINYELTFR